MIGENMILVFFIYILSISSSHAASNSTYEGRRKEAKSLRLETLVRKIDRVPRPVNFAPESWGKQHVVSNNAIFAAAMSITMMRRDAVSFLRWNRINLPFKNIFQ